MKTTLKTVIEPWFSVVDGEEAVAFYKAAFGAVETYRLSEPEAGMVVKLSVDGAEFWISSDPKAKPASPLGGNNSRMILVTREPNELFRRAMAAGATEIFPVGEGHGWRLGRLVDPFGLHWELGHQL